MRVLCRLTLLAVVLFAAGCADDYNKIYYDTRSPLRVAVLPFVERQGGDLFTSAPFALLVDNLPIIGRDDNTGPSTVMRWRFMARIRQETHLDVVTPGYVDSVLIERGLFEKGKFLESDPRDLGKILGADAVLYGEVTKWDRTYLVAETIQTVGIKISMYETQNGTLLWEAQCEATDDSGLTGGPTGYSSAALEPIRGLSGATLYKLADDVCYEIVEPHLSGGAEYEDAHLAPPFIAASAHSAWAGTVKPGDPIHVVAIGSPDCRGTFSLGSTSQEVPMTEFGGGVYVGTYVPLDAKPVDLAGMEVRLIGPGGRVTVQRIDATAAAR